MTDYDPLAQLAAEVENVLDEAGVQRSRPAEPQDEEPDEVPPDVSPLGPRPDTIAEMRNAVFDLLWAKLPTFKETALARTATLMAQLATEERDQPEPPSAAEQDVLDLIQTDGVLPERKHELLTVERALCEARLARITEELEAL